MARFYEKIGQTAQSQKCPRSMCVGAALLKILVFFMQISRKTFVLAFQRYIVQLHCTKTSYHIHVLLIRPYFCDLWFFRPSNERAISQPLPFTKNSLICVRTVQFTALECKLVALFSCIFSKGLASRAGKLHYWGHNHTRTVNALVASSFAIAKLSPLMHLTDRACTYLKCPVTATMGVLVRGKHFHRT